MKFIRLMYLFSSVQAMTRTPPVYTVRWSSQISRSNNRMGPPTNAPNAISGAAPATMNIFKSLYLNYFHQTDNNHCNNVRIDNRSYMLNIENSNQFKSLTDRLDIIHTNRTIFILITQNKFSCLLILLWIYNFLVKKL